MTLKEAFKQTEALNLESVDYINVINIMTTLQIDSYKAGLDDGKKIWK